MNNVYAYAYGYGLGMAQDAAKRVRLVDRDSPNNGKLGTLVGQEGSNPEAMCLVQFDDGEKEITTKSRTRSI